jgi:hypothetical protein
MPYSIGAFALAGLTLANSWIWLLLCLPVYALLTLNLVRRILLPGQKNNTPESPFLAVYLFGLFLLAFSPFAILIKNPSLAANVLNYWWAGALVLLICLVFYWLSRRIRISNQQISIMNKGAIPVENFLGFDWLKTLWQWLAWILSGVIQFLTQLLSGEGGVIWAVVILALLVSLISVGRS